jgi:hypothetical protein
MVLEDAPRKLTRLEILDDWPPDFDKPSRTTVFKWLTRAGDRGLLAHAGTGRRSDPFRYWLPEKEAAWKANPLYELFKDDPDLLEPPW